MCVWRHPRCICDRPRMNGGYGWHCIRRVAHSIDFLLRSIQPTHEEMLRVLYFFLHLALFIKLNQLRIISCYPSTIQSSKHQELEIATSRMSTYDFKGKIAIVTGAGSGKHMHFLICIFATPPADCMKVSTMP